MPAADPVDSVHVEEAIVQANMRQKPDNNLLGSDDRIDFPDATGFLAVSGGGMLDAMGQGERQLSKIPSENPDSPRQPGDPGDPGDPDGMLRGQVSMEIGANCALLNEFRGERTPEQTHMGLQHNMSQLTVDEAGAYQRFREQLGPFALRKLPEHTIPTILAATGAAVRNVLHLRQGEIATGRHGKEQPCGRQLWYELPVSCAALQWLVDSKVSMLGRMSPPCKLGSSREHRAKRRVPGSATHYCWATPVPAISNLNPDQRARLAALLALKVGTKVRLRNRTEFSKDDVLGADHECVISKMPGDSEGSVAEVSTDGYVFDVGKGGVYAEDSVVVSFAEFGGFVYIDKDGQTVGASAIAPGAVGAPMLGFDGPHPLRGRELVEKLNDAERWNPVTIWRWYAAGARYSAWLTPKTEEADGEQPDQARVNKGGGIAFLFHNPGDLQRLDDESQFDKQDIEKLAKKNCYFLLKSEIPDFEEKDVTRDFLLSPGMQCLDQPVEMFGQSEKLVFPDQLGPLGLHSLPPGRLPKMHVDVSTPRERGLATDGGAAPVVWSGGRNATWSFERGISDLAPLAAAGIDVSGRCSPESPLSLPEAARRKAGIPQKAKHYRWAYPCDVTRFTAQLQKQLEDKGASVIVDFAMFGGWLYLSKQGDVLGAKALSPSPGKGDALYFDKPMRWAHEDFTRSLRVAKRWSRVTIRRFSDAGAQFFAWVMPREDCGIPPSQIKHGAFVFLFRGPKQDPDVRDCFFPVAPSAAWDGALEDETDTGDTFKLASLSTLLSAQAADLARAGAVSRRCNRGGGIGKDAWLATASDEWGERQASPRGPLPPLRGVRRGSAVDQATTPRGARSHADPSQRPASQGSPLPALSPPAAPADPATALAAAVSVEALRDFGLMSVAGVGKLGAQLDAAVAAAAAAAGADFAALLKAQGVGVVAAVLRKKAGVADVAELVRVAASDTGLADVGLRPGTVAKIRAAVDAALPRIECPQRRRPPTDMSDDVAEGTLGVVDAAQAARHLRDLSDAGVDRIHPRLALALRTAAARAEAASAEDAWASPQ